MSLSGGRLNQWKRGSNGFETHLADLAAIEKGGIVRTME